MPLFRRAALAALLVIVPRAISAQAPAAPAMLRPVVVRADTPLAPAKPIVVRPNGETWAQISPATVNVRPARFPVGRGHSGPSVLRVQVLLDRALFSPGMIDGRWGQNTQVALYWLQVREGLPATGAVDSATMQRLEAAAGRADSVVHRYALKPEDVRGPFTRIPENIYQQAKLACSCYESLTEKLTESFHSTADLLRKLNPGVRLDGLKAGDTISVPAVRGEVPAREPIAEIWVSGSGRFVHAMSAAGRVLYHFPTTLGSTFDPSPQGDFVVASVHENPWWHYQPRILAHVPDDRPDAKIPPGPNNAVGRVWMALTAPHYGIHGTKSPETIGYATSAGCVRLTNWDALFLARRMPIGTPVRFRDTRAADVQPTGAPRPRARTDSVRPDTARRDTMRHDSAAAKP